MFKRQNTPIPESHIIKGAAIEPPPAVDLPMRRSVTGSQFLGAVDSLGWWAWMEKGAAAQEAAGKPLDGRYWRAIGKSDVIIDTDAKLNRVAKAAEAARVAASGKAAPATPVITIAAIMDGAAKA